VNGREVVGYLRVRRELQGIHGLGIAAQRAHHHQHDAPLVIGAGTQIDARQPRDKRTRSRSAACTRFCSHHGTAY